MDAVLIALLLAASPIAASSPAPRMLVKLQLHECDPDMEEVLLAAADATKTAVEGAGYRAEILWGPMPEYNRREKFFLLEGDIRCHGRDRVEKHVEVELKVKFFPNMWVAAFVSRHGELVHTKAEMSARAGSLFRKLLDETMLQFSRTLEAMPPCVVNVEIHMAPTAQSEIAKEIMRELEAAAGVVAVVTEKFENSTWFMDIEVKEPEVLREALWPVVAGIQERMQRSWVPGGHRIKDPKFGGNYSLGKLGCGSYHLLVSLE